MPVIGDLEDREWMPCIETVVFGSLEPQQRDDCATIAISQPTIARRSAMSIWKCVAARKNICATGGYAVA